MANGAGLSSAIKSARRLGILAITSKGHATRRAYAATSACLKFSHGIMRSVHKQYSLTTLLSGPNKYQNGITKAHLRCQSLIFQRNIVIFSKKGKRKSVKAVVKRFKRLGSGALKRWRSGKNHNMRKKSTNQKRRLRKPVIVKGRQLRKLNRMLNGW